MIEKRWVKYNLGHWMLYNSAYGKMLAYKTYDDGTDEVKWENSMWISNPISHDFKTEADVEKYVKSLGYSVAK